MNISECIKCPKCQKQFMKKSISTVPKLGEEYFCHWCHLYWGVDELVNKWGYDLGEFGDSFPLEVYTAIGKKNNFATNNNRHPWMNLPIMKDWDTPEEDKAWEYLSDKIISTNWFDFDSVSTFLTDEPVWRTDDQKQEAYEIVTRMFLGIPEYAEGCGNQGIDIGLEGYPV